jgi:hypothetical protein
MDQLSIYISAELSLASKIVLCAMGANVCLMGIIAKYKQSHSRQGAGEPAASYIQLISVHLPFRFKIWLVVSSLAGSLLIILLSVRAGS